MSNLRDFTGKNRVDTGTTGRKITSGSTSERVAETGRLRFNASLGLMEYYNGVTWIAIDAPPTITSISPTVLQEGNTTNTITITGSNFSTGATVNLVSEGGSVIDSTSSTRTSSTEVVAVFTTADLGTIDEPYDVKITNSSGLANSLLDSLSVNETPIFSTAAGSLGTVPDGGRTTKTFTITATDPEGGAISFLTSVTAGALPAGTSITDNGNGTCTLSGFTAVSSDTTSTFTIRALDSASNFTERSFSITVQEPVVTSITSTGPASYSVPTGVTQVKVLVVGGGGSSGAIGGGGGAGGLVYHESFPVTPGGSIAYNVGTGAPQTNAHPDPGANPNGNPSTFGTLTALGGESASGWSSAPGGGTVGSGAGGPGTPGTGNVGGTADQPGQSNPGATHNAGFPGAAGGTTPSSNSTTGAGTYTGGGGGGAGFAGGHPTKNGPGNTSTDRTAGRKGGDGLAIDITGSSVYYAGGGGGARHTGGYASPQATAVGGLGGGGASTPASTGQAGTANTGGGGGAGFYTAGGNSAGGAGGSGVIIVSS